jgi:hypothetical protein
VPDRGRPRHRIDDIATQRESLARTREWKQEDHRHQQKHGWDTTFKFGRREHGLVYIEIRRVCAVRSVVRFLPCRTRQTGHANYKEDLAEALHSGGWPSSDNPAFIPERRSRAQRSARNFAALARGDSAGRMDAVLLLPAAWSCSFRRRGDGRWGFWRGFRRRAGS